MKILTVSVAAYNMEKLIRQNLESFVRSPYREDVEVLVIDDGSGDSTAEIVRSYEERFPGVVRLIQQPNAGPGSTVNRGMENASGRYFRMVDADDWVGDGFDEYVTFLKETDADMIVADYVSVDDVTGETRPRSFPDLPQRKVFPFDQACRGMELEMHAVTFRTSLLRENGIRLFNGFYTDMQYLLFPAPFVLTAAYVPVPVYMYRVSLSGQSMAAPSMQRHIGMHDDMLFSIVSLYNDTRKTRPDVAAYILKKLVMISGTEMGTLLSFEPTKENRARLFAFFTRLEKESPDAFSEFKKFRTARALRLCGGAFYPLLCRMHRKRLGL
ncbi:MAG: glycosyltransferase [Clostridia bacterium]|nr:glycosyltransferase [Clostridia bacterium]